MITPQDYGYKKIGYFDVPLKAISKSNEKTSFRHLSTKFVVFENTVAILGRAALRGPRLKLGWVIIRPHFKNRSHSDLNNLPKSIMDGLVNGLVLEDDKYIAVTVTPAIYDRTEKFTIEVWG